MKKAALRFLLICVIFLFSACFYNVNDTDLPIVRLLWPGDTQTGLGLNVFFQWIGFPTIKTEVKTREDPVIDHYVVVYAEESEWWNPANRISYTTAATGVESRVLDYNTTYRWQVFAYQEVEEADKQSSRRIVEGKSNVFSFTTMKEPGEMVTIAPGQFTMGDHFHPEWEGGEIPPWYFNDQPAHAVSLTKNFEIGKYEVTNQEFLEFLNNVGVPFYEEDPAYPTEGMGWLNGRPVIETWWDDPSTGIYYDIVDKKWKIKTAWTNTNVEPNVTVPLNYAAMPVTRVSWYGATFYCDWLSRMSGYAEAYNSSSGEARIVPRDNGGYRLPTEAEWEYCARGGGGDTLYSGTSIFPANYAWFYWNSDLSDGTGRRVHEVGQKLPNELELYDMTGNVFEMCSDWWEMYCAEYAPEGCPLLMTDPAGPEQPDPPVFSFKVMRGGSWGTEDGEDGLTYLSNVRRFSIFPENTESDVGFRIARTVLPEVSLP